VFSGHRVTLKFNAYNKTVLLISCFTGARVDQSQKSDEKWTHHGTMMISRTEGKTRIFNPDGFFGIHR